MMTERIRKYNTRIYVLLYVDALRIIYKDTQSGKLIGCVIGADEYLQLPDVPSTKKKGGNTELC